MNELLATYNVWQYFSLSQPTLIQWPKNINSFSALVSFCPHDPISSRCPRNIIIIIIEHEHTPTYYSPANSSLAFAAWVFVVPLAARPRGISLIRSFQESYIYQTCTKKQQKRIRSNLNSLLRRLDLVDRQKKKKLASSEHHPPIPVARCQTNEEGQVIVYFGMDDEDTESDTCGPWKIIKFLEISSPPHPVNFLHSAPKVRRHTKLFTTISRTPTTFCRHEEVVCVNHDHGLEVDYIGYKVLHIEAMVGDASLHETKGKARDRWLQAAEMNSGGNHTNLVTYWFK